MTPIHLIDSIADFVKEVTKDEMLQVKVRKGNEATDRKRRAANVYKMRLSTSDDETEKIPYILVQFLTGKDDQKPAQPEESTCKVRLVFAVYAEDGSEGALDVLRLILKVKIELEKRVIIADQFQLEYPLEYIVYPDSTAPYYLGEMITEWSIPSIKREVEDTRWLEM